MGKALAFLLALVAGVIVVGWVVSSLIGPVLFYLIVGALVVGGGALPVRQGEEVARPRHPHPAAHRGGDEDVPHAQPVRLRHGRLGLRSSPSL